MSFENMLTPITAAILVSSCAYAHPTHPDSHSGVIIGYELDQDHLSGNSFIAVRSSVNKNILAHAKGSVEIVTDPLGESLMFSSSGLENSKSYVHVTDSLKEVDHLPKKAFTISSWVRIDKLQSWGGIVSAISDNGDDEYGWVLGYNNESFVFGLSTVGADDGNGLLTYISGDTKIQLSNWYFVTATYDGKEAKLYVNGNQDASTTKQSGDILYNYDTPLAIGAYVDSNETNTMEGRIRNAYVFEDAVSAKQIEDEFDHFKSLADLKPVTTESFDWVVEPFLCYATQNSVSIVSEVPSAAEVEIRYRSASGDIKVIKSLTKSGIHTIEITGLQPGVPYYYEVIATDENGVQARTAPSSFQTAVEKGKAFTFVMIGDTQANPEVVKKVSDIAWNHRPNFVCLAGDLVTTGTNKAHWTEHFFPNMQPLLSRIPLFPVLGNHEQNARHYYEYMDLPDPEYYYTYSYGDADYFVLDSEKPMGPGSEQYIWLEKGLQSSIAKWKFVIHHRPAYSSEENDHGNSWLGPTELGDPDVRKAVPLYEKYGVDIVFNGHIHAYERTFPIRENEAVDQNGVIYMTIGGGGGGLEDFAPFNPWFGNKKVSTHHLCFVSINGNHLQLQSIDEQGRLFDMIEIRK